MLVKFVSRDRWLFIGVLEILVLHCPGLLYYRAEGMAIVACCYLGNAVPKGVLLPAFQLMKILNPKNEI
jgi:hypothetical protein